MTRYWPLAQGTYRIGSPFGPRPGGFHLGQDFPADDGTPFYACAGGTVLHIGAASGYGEWVVLDHPAADGGGVTEYGHMWHARATGLKVGDRVEAGQLLGFVGNNGESSGPHLHLSVMPYDYNPATKVDPLAWLTGAAYPNDPPTGGKPMSTDSLFADVSYFQVPVDDSYPHEIFSFRSNDGTFRDPAFARNYRWASAAADSGRLACFIVYFYWRSNWSDCVEVMRDMVEAAGGPHPKMIAMIDVESGGNPGGDQSGGINGAYWDLADWLGDPKRVIGYANTGDFHSMWRTRPDGLRVIAAGYGRVPDLPGQIAHQYTDGQGFGGGLPEGCPPFGNCDMNSANGMTPQQFAAACGVGTGDEMTPEQAQMLKDVWEQLRGPNGQGWPQLGKNDRGEDLTPIDKLATYDARFAKLEAAVAKLGGAK
jgi:hypothetical protein